MPAFTIGFVLVADKMAEKLGLDFILLVLVKLFGCMVNNSARLGVKQKL